MTSFEFPFYIRFVVALALAFLIGLERESASQVQKGRVFAGVRTYSLIGVFGFGCAWMYQVGAPWLLPVGLIAVAALAVIGYLAKLKQGHVGWTSEVAVLLTYVVGALCLLGELWAPSALGIVGTFLLSEKSKLETFVEHLDKNEFLAVVKLLLITVIIMPILPNEGYTRFELNPRHMWQLVVLVAGIGFVGYFLSRKFGSKMGLWLSGLVGGLVSSTAVAITTGRVAQRTPAYSDNALQASLLASSVMYLRILVIVWVVNAGMVSALWLKLVVLAVIGLVMAVTVKRSGLRDESIDMQAPRNPFEIRPALIFACLFVLLSVATVFVREAYGEAGLVVLAAVTGVTDIDPFILSMVDKAAVQPTAIVTAILVAMMSNTIVKGVYFGTLARDMRVQTAWRYGLWALLHLPVILI